MARAAVIPQSPPKRATRGRAKGTTATTKAAPKSAPKGTKGKAAVATKKNTKVGSTTTSAPADSESEEETEDEIGVIETKTKRKGTPARGKASSGSTTSTAGRGRKAPVADPESDSQDDEDELAPSDVPKKRVGRPRAKAVPKEEEAAPAPKTRGRPKGSTTKSITTAADLLKENTRKNTFVDDSEDLSSSQQEPREVFITTNSAAVRSNMLRGPAKKKKVTFQDVSNSEEDEEETSEPTTTRRKGATASKGQAGLAGKPVRKASTPSTRGRKAAASKKEGPKPLSPKKATQVAKAISSYASSDGEDDELSGPKHKINLVVHSPRKSGLETTGLSSPVRRINFTPNKFSKSVDENGEPNLAPPKAFDFSESLFMSSPARRPPPSPFHFTMRETPKRGNLSLNEHSKSLPLSQPNFTPTQNSPLKASPKKAALDTPRRGNLFLPEDANGASQSSFNPPENSPLKSSARRGIFSSSLPSQPHLPQSSTPFRSSLLQSPAKKAVSPFKSSLSLRRPPIMEVPDIDVDDAIDPQMSPEIEQPPLTVQDLDDEMDEEIPDDQESLHDEEVQLRSEQDSSSQVDEDSRDEDAAVGEQPSENAPAKDLRSDEYSGDDRDYEDVDKEVEAQLSEAEDIAENDTYTGPDLAGSPGAIEEEVGENYIGGHFDDSQHDFDDVDEEEGPGEDTFANINRHFDESSPQKEPEDETRQSQRSGEVFNTEEVPEKPGSTLPRGLVGGLGDVFTDNELVPDSTTMEDITPGTDYVSEMVEPDNTEDTDNLPDEMVDEGDHSSEIFAHDNDDEATHMLDVRRNSIPSGQPILPYEVEEPESTAYAYFYMRNVSTMSPVRVLESDDEEPQIALAYSPPHHYFSTEAEIDQPVIANSPSRDSDDLQAHSAPEKGPRFTLLADQLSQWKASSPQNSQPARSQRRGVFSLGGVSTRATDTPTQSPIVDKLSSVTPKQRQSTPPLEDNLDEEVLDIHEDVYEEEANTDPVPDREESPRQPMSEIPSDAFGAVSELAEDNATDGNEVQTSAITGNEPHSTHETSEEEKENEHLPPAVPSTPLRARIPTQTFHTVSKVPLKTEGQISPLKLARKRGRSLSTTSPVRSSPRIHKRLASSNEQDAPTFSPRKSPRLQPVQRVPVKDPESTPVKQRPVSRSKPPSRSSSPRKSPRKGRKSAPPPPQCLRGAVVYVDVHTTEGEDASGIFVELLQQMGARCIKSWSWNPRSSLSPVEGVDPKEGKVGITHVVFKDGGVRTLEKVRQAAGLVKCVGVGWVLDCERENKWLDEAQYAVDSSIIPRGGAKRRKSMEPRALSNVNGTLVNNNTSSLGRRSGAVENFMRSTPPFSREGTTTPENTKKFEFGHTEGDQKYCQTPKTPGSSAYNFNLDSIGMSPATPYYLSQRSRLVQQTCPPKQTREGLFSKATATGEPSQRLSAKLEAARRKSLAFKPSIGSPLVE